MPWTSTFRCDGCGFSRDCAPLSLYFEYRLDSGRTVPIDAVSAWCTRCETVVEVERLVSVVEIDLELAAVGDGKRQALQWWGEGRWERLAHRLKAEKTRPTRDEYVAVLRDLKAWRQDRRSPPRCLSCGDTDFLEIDSVDTFRHPGCCGFIRETDLEHHAVAWLVDPDQLFSPEGERLPTFEP